jgi:hypothetical protein
VALAAVAGVLGPGVDLDEVRFVLFSPRVLRAYSEVLATLEG